MDLSAQIAWGLPCAGILACCILGVVRGRHGHECIFRAALLAALVAGVVLTFVQVFAHGRCIDVAHLCRSRGDGNMAYWFQSFFAIPLYALAEIFAWSAARSRD